MNCEYKLNMPLIHLLYIWSNSYFAAHEVINWNRAKPEIVWWTQRVLNSGWQPQQAVPSVQTTVPHPHQASRLASNLTSAQFGTTQCTRQLTLGCTVPGQWGSHSDCESVWRCRCHCRSSGICVNNLTFGIVVVVFPKAFHLDFLQALLVKHWETRPFFPP